MSRDPSAEALELPPHPPWRPEAQPSLEKLGVKVPGPVSLQETWGRKNFSTGLWDVHTKYKSDSSIFSANISFSFSKFYI